jgi:hypothetical protein
MGSRDEGIGRNNTRERVSTNIEFVHPEVNINYQSRSNLKIIPGRQKPAGTED